MEEFLGFLGFSVGASLTIGATRLLRRGARETAKRIARTGMGMTDSLRRIGDEARAELRRAEPAEAQAEPQPRRRRGRAQDVRTIEIATQ